MGRVWPRHCHRGRPLNKIVRFHQMNDFVVGAITGSAATLVGFAFTIAWDLWKIRRDERRRDQLIVRAVESELEENLEIAAENSKLLEDETKLLETGKHLIFPMLRFKIGMWDLLRANVPEAFLAQENVLNKLRDLSQATSHLNDGISSRQQFKDNMGAFSAFNEILKIKNSALLQEMAQFVKVGGETLELHRRAKGEI
jgi:hypothetical protein